MIRDASSEGEPEGSVASVPRRPGPLEPPRVEFETKYVLPAIAASTVARWLAGRCRPDPRYPEGRVASVYYDTPAMTFLRQKVESQFRKTKVRLRWYADPDSGRITGDAFLEIKRKVGSRRFKTRIPTPGPASLVEAPLHSPAWLEILGHLGEERAALPGDLRPVMEIAFQRLRFVEDVSGARVSLDREIRPRRINSAMLSGDLPPSLPWAVLELKSSRRHLPHPLLGLSEIGCRKSSFSKYERCWMQVTGRRVT